MLVAIVCVDSNYGIGNNSIMPWHNKEELAYFKATTLDHKVIMGSVTYNHLPNDLERRELIIASRKQSESKQVMSFEEIVEAYSKSNETVFVAGGELVYKALVPHCEKVLLSKLKDEYTVDRYFPKELLKQFELVKLRTFDSFDLYIYEKTYEKNCCC